MFAKTNCFLLVFLSLFSVSFAYAQIAPPPGRGAGSSPAKQPPPDQVGIVAIPQTGPPENRAPVISRKDKKLVEPAAEDITKFRALLNKSDYGIAKLLNSRCSAEANNPKVINAAVPCMNSLPGNGAYFSFRRREHSIPAHSDLKLKNGGFVVGSIFTQGVIVSLGEIELEKIGLDTAGVKYIKDFEPARDINGAQKQIAQIDRGLIDSGYLYSGLAEIKENRIYVLRSIAYRTERQTPDKRRDVIVAFQVVRQDEEGNVTLVWKELQNKESPKIGLEK